MDWYYERLKEDGKIERAPTNDYDGKITGKIVFGIKQWFDENPEERKARGWIKHITHNIKDIEFNHQTQYLLRSSKNIDNYTIEDEYHIMNKSEEQMRLQEINNYDLGGSIIFYGGEEEWL